MTSETIVGIDLGTTNSSVAVLVDGVPKVLTEGDDGLVPSCVGLDETGEIVVGRRARNQVVVYPERTVLSVKRRMGTADRFRLGEKEYLPEDISAFILKDLMRRAREALGRNVDRAVITVPAYFTDAQRKATREAGRIAGIEVVRIINEPTAASLVHEFGSGQQARALVYDLGGGTFDVSVVVREKGVVEVLATAGDNRLGGDDFDRMIVDRLNSHLEKEYSGNSFRDDRLVQARLLNAAEAAKKELSSAPFAIVEEDNVSRLGRKPVHLALELTRRDFESDIEQRLMGSLDEMARAMSDAGVAPKDLDRVLLVGGSTRIPLVAQLLRDRLGMTPHGEIDPDRCVALGAAIQAGVEAGADVGSVLVDVTPYTFGIRVIGRIDGALSDHKFVPIIPRNSKLPVKKSDLFTTMTADQEECEVEVFQGEDPDVRNNTRIGEVVFDGLNQYSNAFDEGIVCTFSLGVDGILDVHARERVTGKDISGRIEDALAARSDGDEIDTDGTREDGTGLEASIELLLKRADATLKNASNEDRAEINRLVGGLHKASRMRRTDEVDALAGELSELLYFVE